MTSIAYRCNHYLLITITVCFVAGIIYSGYVPSIFLHPALFFASAAAVCIACRLGLTVVTMLLLAAGSFISGTFIISHTLQEPQAIENHVNRLVLQNQEVLLTGILDQMISGDMQHERAVVELLYLRKKDMDHFIRTGGKVLLSLKGKWPRTIMPGDAVTVRAFLKKPGSVNTPGVFDYREYLAAQDIFTVGTIVSPLLIHKTVIEHHTPSVRHWIEKIRSIIASRLNALDDSGAAGLYRALLLGDRTCVSDDIITAFKRSGTFHILAVSGLHMSLLSFFLFLTFRTLFSYSQTLTLSFNIKKLSLLCCIPVLVIYTFLAGANPPVVRSFIMVFLAVLALCSDRITSPLTIVSCAAFIMLIFDPSSVFTASFQLSFAAVISIIIITPRILSFSKHTIHPLKTMSAVAKTGSWAMALISISLSATIGTAPILLYHFNQLSTVSVPANLVIEPLVCFWGLPLGFLALPFIFFSPEVADFLFQTGALSIKIAVKIATFLASFDFSTVWLPDPSPGIIIFYYLSLFVLVSTKTVPVRIAGTICLCTAMVSLLFPSIPSLFTHRHNSRVSFINVGQGSSTLIEFRQGGTLLIDGGSVNAPGFNSGERIIAPFLWHRRIGKLDDIVLTHADSDHYNGLEVLLRRFHPKRLWLPVTGSGSYSYSSLVDTARELGIEIIYPKNESLFIDHLSSVRILDVNWATGVPYPYPAGQSKNDSGLIIRSELGGTSFLFPGDISAQKEKSLVDSETPLEADILLSPHHGSSTSNSNLFLSAVAAEYLVVSSGESTSLHFPSEKVLKNAKATETSVLRTAIDGTISVTIDDHGYQISCYRNSRWGSCPR